MDFTNACGFHEAVNNIPTLFVCNIQPHGPRNPFLDLGSLAVALAGEGRPKK